MSHYKIYIAQNRQWAWRYVSANGRTIADSAETYHNKADALNGIALMKASHTSPVYE
ncbi:MAG: DUF1508 domain-containing protein [Sphingomonadales bacterium]|nr:MAG: DUF1508 domain-containing protein [Sphingomonadales bacterium]